MATFLAWVAWVWAYVRLVPTRYYVMAGLLLVAFFGGCACVRGAEPPACPVNGANCTCGCRTDGQCNCAAPDPVQASVRVDVPYTDGTTHSGSGTVVALYTAGDGRPACIILTNRHVCPKDSRIKVTWPGNKFASEAGWLGCDDQADIAALYATAPDDAIACRPAVKSPACGEELVQVGYPRTRGPIRRVGAAVGGAPDFAAAIRTENGDSGSGLFDRRGRLVAVCWGLNLQTGQCCCVCLQDVQRFLLRPATRKMFPELHDVAIPPRVAVQPAPVYAPVFAPFGAPACRSCR